MADMKITAEVTAGVCKFKTVIQAESDGEGKVELKITSLCPQCKRMEKTITAADPYAELFGAGDNEGESVYEKAQRLAVHKTCPVPLGILKAIEAAAGLALPVSASIEMSKGE
ncbi:MAG: hypothetical protein GX061_04780 [Eubacteriaceae bacterium]|nr:hypothetical protein [Eubacteriaceae bacterium]